MTAYEGQYCYNNIGEINGAWEFREEVREIPEPIELYHKKLN